MFQKRSCLTLFVYKLKNSFSTSIETYKITAKGPATGGVIFTSGKTKNEFEIKSAIDSLLASLVGCENTTACYYAKTLDIEVRNISFEVEADYDARLFVQSLDTPNRFSQIRIKAEVDTDGTREDVEKLKELVLQHSPIDNMLRMAGVEFQESWTKKQKKSNVTE